jgi:hypothetical protein
MMDVGRSRGVSVMDTDPRGKLVAVALSNLLQACDSGRCGSVRTEWLGLSWAGHCQY